MMTERLRQVVAQIERLAPEVQDAIAAMLQQELEEREWDALVSTSSSQRFLQQLADEARAEQAAGTIRDLDDVL